MKIVITVSGHGVSLSEYTYDAKQKYGQLSGLPFVAENQARITLIAAIRKYWNADNTVVVYDAEFNRGYYRVTTHCGANGAGLGYRLHELPVEKDQYDTLDQAFRAMESENLSA